MSIENYIRDMPKVALDIHLEGAIPKEQLLLIAEQNEINEQVKHFDRVINTLHKPDFNRLDELIDTFSTWVQQPDDLIRIVYELGVYLHRQHVRYAEVHINPMLFMRFAGSFEQFMEIINDGRARAERAWGIRMNWLLTIDRHQPRSADEIVRWASSAAARRGGVVGIGLRGREDVQPVGQFERAFKTAEKKELARVVDAGHVQGAKGIIEAVQQLHPQRIIGGWGLHESPEAVDLLMEGDIAVTFLIGQAVSHGWIEDYAAYPLRVMLDTRVPLIIGTGMPALYETSLTDEYLQAASVADLSLAEINDLALNAVRYSRLGDEEKAAIEAEFTAAYADLQQMYLASDQTQA